MARDDDELLSKLDQLLAFAGLEESAVDGDDDEALDALSEEPERRSNKAVDAIEALVDGLRALRRFNRTMRRQLCRQMVLATIRGRGAVVLSDGEVLDAHCVVCCGVLRWSGAGCERVLLAGDEFGLLADDVVFRGRLETLSSVCRILCIPAQAVQQLESRAPRASKEQLLKALLEDDDEQLQVLLLTLHVFADDQQLKSLLEQHAANRRERVLRVLCAWIAVCNDFPHADFALKLASRAPPAQAQLVHVALSASARPRQVTATPPIDVVGGRLTARCGGALFVRTPKDGLWTGDEVLCVNGVDLQTQTRDQALQLLTASSLQLTVRFDPHAFFDGARADEEPPKDVVTRVLHNEEARYLRTLPSTTARELTMLVVAELQLAREASSSRDFALYEARLLEDGQSLKVRRLPENASQLHQLPSTARLYVRALDARLPEAEIAEQLAKESCTSLQSLPPEVVARALTEQSLKCFRAVDGQQFVADAVELKRDDAELRALEAFTNRQLFWTVNQVLFADNRHKTVKRLLSVCQQLKEMRNFNSLFALLAGLTHQSVSRLKMKPKHSRVLKTLQQLMDPSRNMRAYRTLAATSQRPLVPFLPLLKKDLAFAHLANPTLVDGLFNLDKLAALAKIVADAQQLLVPVEQSEQPTDLSAKKRWEEAHVRKKVDEFLEKSLSCLELDEDALMLRSCELEAPVRRSAHAQPSPTPSGGSNSSQRLKFGAENESELRKLLALSNRVAPRKDEREKNGAVAVGTQGTSPRDSESSSSSSSSLFQQAQSLSSESSSVVSLRQLDARFERAERRAPPSYSQTMQRLERRGKREEHQV